MYIIILYGNSGGGVPATQYAHKPWERSHPHSFAGGLHLTWKFHRDRDRIIVDWPTVVVIYIYIYVCVKIKKSYFAYLINMFIILYVHNSTTILV